MEEGTMKLEMKMNEPERVSRAMIKFLFYGGAFGRAHFLIPCGLESGAHGRDPRACSALGGLPLEKLLIGGGGILRFTVSLPCASPLENSRVGGGRVSPCDVYPGGADSPLFRVDRAVAGRRPLLPRARAPRSSKCEPGLPGGGGTGRLPGLWEGQAGAAGRIPAGGAVVGGPRGRAGWGLGLGSPLPPGGDDRRPGHRRPAGARPRWFPSRKPGRHGRGPGCWGTQSPGG